jgi:hypothetical protein
MYNDTAQTDTPYCSKQLQLNIIHGIIHTPCATYAQQHKSIKLSLPQLFTRATRNNNLKYLIILKIKQFQTNTLAFQMVPDVFVLDVSSEDTNVLSSFLASSSQMACSRLFDSNDINIVKTYH